MSLLARVFGGEFIESNSAQLSNVFTQIESQLTSAYVIHYRSLAPLGHHVAVSVRVDGVPQAATIGYDSPAPPRAATTAPPRQVGEIGACSRLVLGAPSVYNAAVLAILTLAQTARMRWEKRALALAFTEYPCMRLTRRLMPYRPSSTRDTASAAP
jgi:hypothetical protein